MMFLWAIFFIILVAIAWVSTTLAIVFFKKKNKDSVTHVKTICLVSYLITVLISVGIRFCTLPKEMWFANGGVFWEFALFAIPFVIMYHYQKRKSITTL